MHCGYRYRFYPTAVQKEFLNRSFGCVRYIFNRALDARSTAWRDRKESIGFKQTNALLTGWKNPDLSWLKEPSCVPLQQSLRQLDAAFQRFFGKIAGYPQFRRKQDVQTLEFTRSGFRMRGTDVLLGKLDGTLNIRWSRKLPSDPSTLTITRECDGRWYVSFRVEVEPEVLEGGRSSIGIDLGITHFATLSTSEKIEGPKPLKAALKNLPTRRAGMPVLKRAERTARNAGGWWRGCTVEFATFERIFCTSFQPG